MGGGESIVVMEREQEKERAREMVVERREKKERKKKRVVERRKADTPIIWFVKHSCVPCV